MSTRAWLLLLVFGLSFGAWGRTGEPTPDLWTLAERRAKDHRFSTLFTAQDVRQHLASEAGLARAIEWCRATAVTHVYVESFRDGYQAEREALRRARAALEAAGLTVSGCITPTQIGRKSSRWNIIPCYTDGPTQDRLQAIFEFAAGLFNEIMIDDFWFTDCACAECDQARVSRTVVVGGRGSPVPGDTWEDYRRELMFRMSQERVLAPSRRINPKVKLILKYPQWYDQFHERGYDVDRQTRIFDRIWVGTETRDYEDKQWGGTVQYEAWFIMRWLGGIGGRKCGGGWFDWLGTTEKTYLEQARQTVLGGARESMLFCYGGLQGTTGPANVAALRREIPELLDVARQVRRRDPVGLAAYKPPNSHPEDERRVFDFVGMLGLPLVPCHEFPTRARAAFFSVHALKDPDFPARLERLVAAGRPVLLTDGLVRRLGAGFNTDRPQVRILPVRGDPKSLLTLPPAELEALRAPMLRPWDLRFEGPARVALYLFDDDSRVVENFNDTPVEVRLNGQASTLPARGWSWTWR